MRARWWVSLALCSACAGPAALPQVPPELAARLEFEGARAFSREELLGAIQRDMAELERRSSKRSVVDDAAYSLEQFYADHGFGETRVTYAVEERAEGLARARFTIDEGPRTVLDQVELEGAVQVPIADLLAAVGWQNVGSADAPVWFVERNVDDAADLIRRAYAERGFARATVDEPLIELSSDQRRAKVVLRISEDVPYYVRERPRLDGGIEAVDAGVDFSDYLGRRFALDVAPALRLRIAGAYGTRGYPDARVAPATVVYQRVEGEVWGAAVLTFKIVPGEHVQIRGIEVRGNKRTRPDTVLSELVFDDGDAWDSRKEQESFRRLYRTGLFSRVDLRLEPESGTERKLVVEVAEAPSSEFYVEPGYGSYERLRVLAGWREKNLFGFGQTLEVEGLLAQLTQKGLVRLTSPHILGSELDGNVSVFSEHRIEPSFVRDEVGFGFGLAREFTRRKRVTAEYRFRSSDVSDADLTDPNALAALQDVDISSIQISPTWDTRDNPLGPSTGWLVKVFGEFASSAFGSELAFLRGGFTVSRFFPLRPETVVGFNARTGVIAPIESTTDIPLQERYFNGGENTVRSFKEDELGPKDSAGNPLGGEAYDVISIELRQRLAGNFEGALFYDGGNVVDDYHDWGEFSGFRHALGVGLRYRLPIGPVRVDWALNPDARADEDEWVLHVSVGMAF